MRYKETGVDSQTHTFGALLSASQTVCSLMAQEKQMAAYAAACFSFAPIILHLEDREGFVEFTGELAKVFR